MKIYTKVNCPFCGAEVSTKVKVTDAKTKKIEQCIGRKNCGKYFVVECQFAPVLNTMKIIDNSDEK